MMTVIVNAAPRTDARERMIRTAVLLFREQGIDGTSFNDVIERSGAPRGSIYHHFPGGKAQLAEEATRYAGDLIARGLAAALEGDDPVAAVRGFAAVWLQTLTASECTAGCPIVAAALEGKRTPEAVTAAGEAFTRMTELLAGAFERRGVAPERARAVALTSIAAIEGAIVLSRAQRSIEPLREVAGELERMAIAALP
jgi:AcrR family transcriptional regulator